MFSCSGGCFAYFIFALIANFLGDFIAEIFNIEHSYVISILIFIILICVYNALGKSRNWCGGRVHAQRYQRSDFLESLLILSSAVIKADGHFKRSELDYLRAYFTQNLGSVAAQRALQRLQEIMNEEHDVDAVCRNLHYSSTIHERLLIVQFLFGLAYADGELHPLEVAEIKRVAILMGVSQGDFESIKSMYTGGYYQSGGYSSGSSGSSGGSTYRSHTLDDDYRILEVSPDASDDEVKKAYRNMAKKYHPDRVAHLGEEMRKQAEQKFARLSDAYDNIKRSRGMN